MLRQLEGFPSGQREQTVNLPRKLRRFESFPLHQVFAVLAWREWRESWAGGHSSMVEPQPSKLMMRVRSPLPAPVSGM